VIYSLVLSIVLESVPHCSFRYMYKTDPSIVLYKGEMGWCRFGFFRGFPLHKHKVQGL